MRSTFIASVLPLAFSITLVAQTPTPRLVADLNTFPEANLGSGTA